MRVYNNNTVGSPEQCVNMDTMEMHYAIMAGFMHFSLTGREGEKFSKRKGKQRRGATGRGKKRRNGGEKREERRKAKMEKTEKEKI